MAKGFVGITLSIHVESRKEALELLANIHRVIAGYIILQGHMDFRPYLAKPSACRPFNKIYRENKLPTIDEFIRSDPSYTGDMTTEEYIRSIRSA